MNFLVEAERLVRRLRQQDSRLADREASADQLRVKFESVLEGRTIINCNFLGQSRAPLPLNIGGSGVVVLLVNGFWVKGEYFCSIQGEDAGIGFKLKGVKPQAFPITTLPIAGEIDFGGENEDSLGKDFQRLAFGHRLADFLIEIRKGYPNIFREGFN